MSRAPLLRARRRQGMTLVEIMVVLAILGVLIAVLAVNFGTAKDDADVDTTRIQIKQIEDVLLRYSLKHKGKYPASLDEAAKYFPGEKVPTDAWGNPFVYRAPATSGGHPYEVISLGKDGKEGGDEANADIVSWDMAD